MTTMLESWEHDEGYEKQLVLAHFEWIGVDETGKMEVNSRESYSSQDEN